MEKSEPLAPKEREKLARSAPFFADWYLSGWGDWGWTLRHPFKTLKELWLMLRAAWIRGMRGWHESDVWSMESYFTHIYPPMLRALSGGYGHPTLLYLWGECYMDSTEQDWETFLLSCAQAIENWDVVQQEPWRYSRQDTRAYHDAAKWALHALVDNWTSLWD